MLAEEGIHDLGTSGKEDGLFPEQREAVLGAGPKQDELVNLFEVPFDADGAVLAEQH